MPSFNNSLPMAPSSKPMSDVFASPETQNLLEEQQAAISARAREVLTILMPCKIRTLEGYLATANDPASALWAGHLRTGAFVKAELTRPSGGSAIGGAGAGPPVEEGNADEPDGHECVARDDSSCGDAQGGNTQTEASETAYEGKPGVTWTGGLVRNKVFDDLLPLLERECSEVILLCRDLESYIMLNVPVIEDGNNFGVDVQEHILEKVQKVMRYARQAQGLPRSHYADRMKLAMTWCRYPNLEDHAAAIAASDRLDHFLVKESFGQLSQKLTDLLRALSLNWSKVHAPKGGSGADSMY